MYVYNPFMRRPDLFRMILRKVMIIETVAMTIAVLYTHYYGTESARLAWSSVFREGCFMTYVSAANLVLCGLMFFMSAYGSAGSGKKGWTFFWIIMGASMVFLALDDLFMVHEHLDNIVTALLGMNENGFTDRLDDIIVLLYGAVMAVFLYINRHYLKGYRALLMPFLIFCALFLFSQSLDLLFNRTEVFEMLGAESVETYHVEKQDGEFVLSEANNVSGYEAKVYVYDKHKVMFLKDISEACEEVLKLYAEMVLLVLSAAAYLMTARRKGAAGNGKKDPGRRIEDQRGVT